MWAVSKIKQLEGTGQTHPDLKPYDLMTDAQKEYDRKASTDTLKYVRFNDVMVVRHNLSSPNDMGVRHN